MSNKVLQLGAATKLSDPEILKTKLHIPRVQLGLVSRPQLMEKLDRGLEEKLTLVVAPAGFGKTTALVEWVRHRDLSCCWFSLDPADNDPVRFYSYLIAALKTIEPRIGSRALSVLQSTASLERAVAILIDDLCALPRQFILLLDDYHLILEPRIHESLSFFIEYMPAHVHFVISSRSQPPLSPVQLRLKGQLTQLDPCDLQFGQDEVVALYRQMNIHLTGEQVRKLEACTEGWAAGLQMAAWSIQGSADISGVIADFSGKNRYIATYLTEEVFNKWPQSSREFFLQTSILDRLCGPLCDAVAGREDSVELLEKLAATNAFVYSLDEERRWYRYHHLFAGFLQGLLGEKGSSQLPSLHQRAARWYEKNGFIHEAVGHCLQGEDFNRAVLLIERLAPEMLCSRETIMFQGWLKALPESLLSRSVILCLAYAWTGILTEQSDLVERWLQNAEAGIQEEGERQKDQGWVSQMAGEIAILKAYLANQRKDMKAIIRLIVEASHSITAKSHFLGNLVLGNEEPSLLGGFLGCYGCLKLKAEALKNNIGARIRNMAAPYQYSGYIPIADAEFYYEQNEMDRATEALIIGMGEAELAESPGSLVPGIFTLAMIHRARGNLEEAVKVVGEGENNIRPFDQPQWLPSLAALEARLYLEQGDMDAVDQWMSNSRLNVYDRPSGTGEYEHITLARVLIARRRWDDALMLLMSLKTYAEAGNRIPARIEIGNLLAIVLQAKGETGKAMEALQKSLALGEENGYLRRFIDEGVPMLELLRRYLRGTQKRKWDSSQVSSEYVRRLHRLIKQEVIARKAGSGRDYQRSPTSGFMPEPLTRREVEVLRLMALELTNGEIADRLDVRLNTVKNHTANIYGKLHVKTRDRAVDRGMALGIL